MPFDKDQFHEVYQSHFKEIYSYIAYSVGKQSDAEDLTQEVFLKAYRAFGSFRGDSDVRTWLYSIARNTVRTFISRNKTVSASEEDLVLVPSKDPLPEAVVTNREKVGLLQQALLKLSEEQRTIIIMRNIQGYSTKETAQMLGCTETKVKVQLFRALRKLRKLLEDNPAFQLDEELVSQEVRSL